MNVLVDMNAETIFVMGTENAGDETLECPSSSMTMMDSKWISRTIHLRTRLVCVVQNTVAPGDRRMG